MIDALTELLFPDHNVRGAYVDLRGGIAQMLGWRSYAPDVAHLLGQSLAAAPLLASHSKFDGRISIQFQGAGPVKLLVTQIDAQFELRGMAKAAPDAHGGLQDLLKDGLLALLLEPSRGAQHYRALVPVEGATLGEALENYFSRSEQLETFIRLAAAPERFCGLMLQALPPRQGQADAQGWEHLRTLAGTLTEAEMLEVDGMTLLHRLFHAEDRRILDPRPVRLACRCSHASISNMLLSLGEKELEPLIEERGKVDVTCEFCGREYSYTDLEVRSLFAAARSGPENQVIQ
ncbi:MAG TPA: Hsp33 family molecular chaperone HslO [Solimonas sp.]|nr:Hsp33 family molecular chaperone HslO [Solimonas sp.]